MSSSSIAGVPLIVIAKCAATQIAVSAIEVSRDIVIARLIFFGFAIAEANTSASAAGIQITHFLRKTGAMPKATNADASATG